ncbi:hypothetical protein RB195_005817 [Necator americanus]|uniref:Uncharacterized protein n=1 Tax=Necator americanus TaxID=51031 RepID=A0ABR1BT30_NECAM
MLQKKGKFLFSKRATNQPKTSKDTNVQKLASKISSRESLAGQKAKNKAIAPRKASAESFVPSKLPTWPKVDKPTKQQATKACSAELVRPQEKNTKEGPRLKPSLAESTPNSLEKPLQERHKKKSAESTKSSESIKKISQRRVVQKSAESLSGKNQQISQPQEKTPSLRQPLANVAPQKWKNTTVPSPKPKQMAPTVITHPVAQQPIVPRPRIPPTATHDSGTPAKRPEQQHGADRAPGAGSSEHVATPEFENMPDDVRECARLKKQSSFDRSDN